MRFVVAALIGASVLVWWPATPLHRLTNSALKLPSLSIPFGPKSRSKLTARRMAALDLVAGFAAELATGAPATHALIAAIDSIAIPIAPATRVAAMRGGDAAAALELDAEAHALPLLRSLAACWRVGERSGAGLGDAVEQLPRSARSVEEINVQLEAQLAAPRATARMLATLPLIGVVLGMLLGANPIGWLTTTGPGLFCLAGGTALTLLGWMWTARISAHVSRLM